MLRCSGKPADLIGTPCNLRKLSVSYTGSNESNTNELTFTQISKGMISPFTGVPTPWKNRWP
ncbi:hypothetical protein NXW13_00885 [Bacteroides thetaiotaomicron]|nr:hypothetical protein [Bacteroides thetaiotaomicron]